MSHCSNSHSKPCWKDIQPKHTYRTKLENGWKNCDCSEKSIKYQSHFFIYSFEKCGCIHQLVWAQGRWLTGHSSWTPVSPTLTGPHCLWQTVWNTKISYHLTPKLWSIFQLISSAHERYHFCLQDMPLIISWGHDFIVWEKPSLKSLLPHQLCLYPALCHHTWLVIKEWIWAHHTQGAWMGNAEALLWIAVGIWEVWTGTEAVWTQLQWDPWWGGTEGERDKGESSLIWLKSIFKCT